MILDGKKIAERTIRALKKEVEKLNPKPCLAIIKIGKDKASDIYIKAKKKACEEIGISLVEYGLSEYTKEKDIIMLIELLNKGDANGILVQLPLPKHINVKRIMDTITPDKDVDGFNPASTFTPCTPKGIIRLLKECDLQICGKKVVVVGCSEIVGKPVANLLLNEGATVTVCHSNTSNLSRETLQADILVVATGKPYLIKRDMVKEGAIVIDVGINKVGKKIVGDVDFEGVKDKCSYITPVPGGVGPMTVAMLMENVVESYKNEPR